MILFNVRNTISLLWILELSYKFERKVEEMALDIFLPTYAVDHKARAGLSVIRVQFKYNGMYKIYSYAIE